MQIPRIAYIIGAIVAIGVIAFVVVATIFGWWGIVVDITLTLTALLSLALLGLLTYAVFSLLRTALKIRSELIPVLQSLRETTDSVRETARAATAFGVQPAARTASAVLSFGEIASVMFGRGQAQTRAAQRQRRRLEIEREEAEQERQEQEAQARSAANGRR